MIKKRNKFNNKKTNGFHSKRESERYEELKKLEKEGEILALELQPRFLLQDSFESRGKKYRKIEYIADFKYFDKQFGCPIVEDVKGMKTDVYKLKKKLFIRTHPQYIFLETS